MIHERGAAPLAVNPTIRGIAVAKDNDISPAIAMAIDQMIAAGTDGEFVAKWNLESDAFGSAEVIRELFAGDRIHIPHSH